MLEEITRIDPDFENIVKLCVKELEIKYSNYGNTWVELDDIYYKERLKKEVLEYVESMTVESERRKLLNIINIAAMAHQTAESNRGCRKHKPPFEDIVKSKDDPYISSCMICGKDVVIKHGIVYLPMEKFG